MGDNSSGEAGPISDPLEEVKKRSKNLHSKYEYCKTLTFLSESLKKQTLHSSEEEVLKTSVLEHFKADRLEAGLRVVLETCETSRNNRAIAAVCDRAVEIILSSKVSHAAAHMKPSRSAAPPAALDEEWVRAESPARVDMAGAWTDTPPICSDYGGNVIGAAVKVDGKNPIGCRVRRTTKLHFKVKQRNSKEDDRASTFEYSSPDEMLDFDNPASDAAVIKACIELVGIRDFSETGHGLEIETWSDLPVGSGMGTSSILAGCVLSALWTAVGTSYSLGDLNHAVLIVEQMLTTGGGWQDQVNGLYPGIKQGRSAKSEADMHVRVEQIKLADDFSAELGRHMLLVFTGKVRLAKNLLRTVITQWYEGSKEIVDTIERNYALADELARTLSGHSVPMEDRLEAVGKHLSEFWTLKRTLAKGSEPQYVTDIFTVLRPHCHGMSLCGAGGGGFMAVITKKRSAMSEVEGLLARNQLASCTVHEVQISHEGLTVTKGDVPIEIQP